MEAKCSYWELWSIPGVYQYALCYFCLKSCQYGFLFWLPTYIDYQGISEWASSIATLFDIATFTGGILIGYVSDTIRKRALIMFPSLVIASCLCVSIKFYLTN
jgi:sugar phosphate permease